MGDEWLWMVREGGTLFLVNIAATQPWASPSGRQVDTRAAVGWARGSFAWVLQKDPH